jgi:hypothetical protein
MKGQKTSDKSHFNKLIMYLSFYSKTTISQNNHSHNFGYSKKRA